MPAEKIVNIDHELLSQINEIRKNGNFQTVKKTIGEEKMRQFICALYPKYSITEIESMTGISDSTLEHWFKRLNIPSVRNHIYNVSFAGCEDNQTISQKDGETQKVSTIKITPELAYVIGFTLGDGSVQKFMLEVFNKDKTLKHVLFDYLKPYGSITEDERQNGLWRLRLSNGKIANLIKKGNEIRQDTLDYIFNNETLAKHFIAAFWDAEGTVLRQIKRDKPYYHIYLYNSNRNLINHVCNFLNSKNITFSLHERPTRDEEFILNGRTVKSNKTLIRINIHKVSWMDWINQIGALMHHSKKRKMINELMCIKRID